MCIIFARSKIESTPIKFIELIGACVGAAPCVIPVTDIIGKLKDPSDGGLHRDDSLRDNVIGVKGSGGG